MNKWDLARKSYHLSSPAIMCKLVDNTGRGSTAASNDWFPTVDQLAFSRFVTELELVE